MRRCCCRCVLLDDAFGLSIVFVRVWVICCVRHALWRRGAAACAAECRGMCCLYIIIIIMLPIKP
jgi:hypothetical protein